MDYLNFKPILISLFLLYFIQDVSAKCLPTSSNDAIEQAFADLSSNEDVIHAEYNLHIGDELVTICWNHNTTLHFYHNGTKYGYVEYSISMETKSGDHTPDNRTTEPYEILNQNSLIPKTLDFVQVSKDDDKVVKENITVICRSDKVHTRTFTNLEGRKRVEVKLRPVMEELDMNSVKALSSIGGVTQRLLSEDHSTVATTFNDNIEEFEDLSQRYGAPEDSNAPDHQLAEEGSTTSRSTEDASSIEAAATPSSTDQTLIADRQLTESNGIATSEAPETNQDDSTEAQSDDCKIKSFLKVKLNVQDDSGLLRQLEKELEIDAHNLTDLSSSGDFGSQLALLIRDQFGDVFNKEKKCEETKANKIKPEANYAILEETSEDNRIKKESEDVTVSSQDLNKKKEKSSNNAENPNARFRSLFEPEENELLQSQHVDSPGNMFPAAPNQQIPIIFPPVPNEQVPYVFPPVSQEQILNVWPSVGRDEDHHKLVSFFSNVGVLRPDEINKAEGANVFLPALKPGPNFLSKYLNKKNFFLQSSNNAENPNSRFKSLFEPKENELLQPQHVDSPGNMFPAVPNQQIPIIFPPVPNEQVPYVWPSLGRDEDHHKLVSFFSNVGVLGPDEINKAEGANVFPSALKPGQNLFDSFQTDNQESNLLQYYHNLNKPTHFQPKTFESNYHLYPDPRDNYNGYSSYQVDPFRTSYGVPRSVEHEAKLDWYDKILQGVEKLKKLLKSAANN